MTHIKHIKDRIRGIERTDHGCIEELSLFLTLCRILLFSEKPTSAYAHDGKQLWHVDDVDVDDVDVDDGLWRCV